MKPKLRFPEFTGEWKPTFLGDMASVTKLAGFEFTKHVQYSDKGKIIALRGLNIKGLKLDLSDVKYIDKSDFSMLGRSKLFVGDIIFTYVGTIGNTALIPENDRFYLAPNVALIRMHSALNTFLVQILQSDNYHSKEIAKHITSSSQPALSMQSIRKFVINIPTINEQLKISNLLNTVDQKINLLTKKKQALEAYKKGLMQKIFSQELRFKREDGTDYPDWEWIALEDILDYEQPTKYIVSSTEYDDSYNTPVLTAGKTFVLGYTNEANGIFSQTPIILFDDFTTDFKFVNFPFKVKSSAAKILKLKRSADMLYVHEGMHTIKFPRGEHKRYWISEFSKMEIPFPTLDEQIKISALIQSTNAMLEVNEKLLRSSIRLKKGLLQQMFV